MERRFSSPAERCLRIFDAEDDENVSAEKRLPLILALLHFFNVSKTVLGWIIAVQHAGP